MNTPDPTALLADDEALLLQSLEAELARAWPALRVVARVGDGASAVQQALALRPRVLFLDIRMPGLGGLDAAAEIAEAWPAGQALPALVFVTAHDEFAVRAFELQALDYVLKPVQPERLERTVARLQAALAQPPAPESTLEALRQLLTAPAGGAPAGEPLTVIQAALGSAIHFVPIDQVLCLDAADKYLRVLTAQREYLIRTPLKDLLPRLDAAVFWQVHRGTVVRATAIESVHRDEAGRLSLVLRGLRERIAVSRLHAGRFRAM